MLDVERVEVDVGIAEIRRASIYLDILIECATSIAADTAVFRIDAKGKSGVYGIAGGGIVLPST
jgi:hypothetical protein